MLLYVLVVIGVQSELCIPVRPPHLVTVRMARLDPARATTVAEQRCALVQNRGVAHLRWATH